METVEICSTEMILLESFFSLTECTFMEWDCFLQSEKKETQAETV